MVSHAVMHHVIPCQPFANWCPSERRCRPQREGGGGQEEAPADGGLAGASGPFGGTDVMGREPITAVL